MIFETDSLVAVYDGIAAAAASIIWLSIYLMEGLIAIHRLVDVVK